MAFELDHIHFRCQDLDAAIDFYVNILGGEILRRSDSTGMTIVVVTVGGTKLALSPPREGVEPAAALGWGVYQIGMIVDDLASTVIDLKAKGAEFNREPVEIRPGLNVAFLKAPDGMEIELMEYS
jgi:catechol 2,3-dioxygenase-like lactoylglutathione lyase family enzyme